MSPVSMPVSTVGHSEWSANSKEEGGWSERPFPFASWAAWTCHASLVAGSLWGVEAS